MLVWFTFWMHMPVWFISTNWRLHCWIPSLSAVLFSVADPDTVEQLSEQWRVPFPLAKRVAEFFPLLFIRWSRSNSLNAYFSDLWLEEQNLSSQDIFCIKSLIKVTTRVRTRMVFLRALLGDFILKQATNIYVTLSVTEDNFRRKTLSRDI